MQNRYAGDVGDYGKFGLLRALTVVGLRTGVVWYLNEMEESNGDGQIVKYGDLASCDPKLHAALQNLILQPGARNVACLEATLKHCHLLPSDTPFFAAAIGSRPRTDWFTDALAGTRSADLVFLDPDNGVRFGGGSASPKHARFDELLEFLRRGQSVICYQHAFRQEDWVQQRLELLRNSLQDSCFDLASWSVVFRPKQARAYLVIAQQQHEARLRLVSEALTNPSGSWKGCFEYHALQDGLDHRRPATARDDSGVITNCERLMAADVAHKKVLCPACGRKVFEKWPEGWDGHAGYTCGIEGSTPEERKENFKKRFRHLFR